MQIDNVKIISIKSIQISFFTTCHSVHQFLIIFNALRKKIKHPKNTNYLSGKIPFLCHCWSSNDNNKFAYIFYEFGLNNMQLLWICNGWKALKWGSIKPFWLSVCASYFDHQKSKYFVCYDWLIFTIITDSCSFVPFENCTSACKKGEVGRIINFCVMCTYPLWF